MAIVGPLGNVADIFDAMDLLARIPPGDFAADMDDALRNRQSDAARLMGSSCPLAARLAGSRDPVAEHVVALRRRIPHSPPART